MPANIDIIYHTTKHLQKKKEFCHPRPKERFRILVKRFKRLLQELKKFLTFVLQSTDCGVFNESVHRILIPKCEINLTLSYLYIVPIRGWWTRQNFHQ